MAFQKNLILPSGVTGNYWRVAGVVLDLVNQAAEVHLALYKDRAARDGNRPAITTQSFQFGAVQGQVNPKPFPFTFNSMNEDMNNPAKIAYVEIKKEPFFQDAEDV